MPEIIKQKIKELTLLLLWLTSWEEKIGMEDLKIRRSWKGYDFGVLDELKKDGFISGSYKAKSVYLTEKGIEKAKQLEEIFINQL